MNSKELFMLIDNIDEQFVEEAWEGGIESEKPVKVFFEHRPSPAIRLAAAAAACVLMFGAGLFIGIKFFGGVPVLPGSEAENSSSDSETNSDDNENHDSDTESSDSEPENSDSESTNSDIEKLGFEEFSFYVTKDIPASHLNEKQDNLNYAVIDIKFTDATEENPILAYICSGSNGGHKKIISETIKITGDVTDGKGLYQIHYEGLRGAGSLCVLVLEMPNENEAAKIRCMGRWSP